ncbi:uroporphyrin-3 C-methyltransferase [Avibacterium gallinarum]|uniref:HemX family protein n=2 Tax=Avibacterium gallinarum TaxID=755 RepID=A0A379B084_AVIGA|nr:uroporphyrinogen-III C-methyltransferase [Avibacterium gallinarum]TDP29313.1 uroporphyrin-3 C-methyltransferase [Avibacterium gallinarum]SUB28118.1 HemX family protein [Avibacterium gallinarum]
MAKHHGKKMGKNRLTETSPVQPVQQEVEQHEVGKEVEQEPTVQTSQQQANRESEANPQNTEQNVLEVQQDTDSNQAQVTEEQTTMKEKEQTQERDELSQQAKSSETEASQSAAEPQTVIVKKGGTGVAILALLVALGLGGAGYYFAEQHLTKVQGRLTALEQRAVPANVQGLMDSDLAALKQDQAKIAQLAQTSQSTNDKLTALEKMVEIKDQQITSLQNQVKNLSNAQKTAQPNDWLLSEADFLLNNALRKLVLDNDVDTAVSLLKVADETLSKVSDPRAMQVRSAINADLKQLLSVNNIDQNAIMQHLSQLANNVDELTVLNVNFDDPNPANEKLSGSWEDWKENAEKSATSFLNHFIRVTPKNAESKALLAPNQDIYLRENIRLRLQLAIMAVPRQQNDLYKQSLETVASWVRSYFDTNTEVAKTFLNEVDELAEQSIYVDVPTQLSSLNMLDKLLNKPSQEVQKIEISVDKDVAKETAQEAKAAPVEQPVADKAENNVAQSDANQSEKPSENQADAEKQPDAENKSAVENSDKSEQTQQ